MSCFTYIYMLTLNYSLYEVWFCFTFLFIHFKWASLEEANNDLFCIYCAYELKMEEAAWSSMDTLWTRELNKGAFAPATFQPITHSRYLMRSTSMISVLFPRFWQTTSQRFTFRHHASPTFKRNVFFFNTNQNLRRVQKSDVMVWDTQTDGPFHSLEFF